MGQAYLYSVGVDDYVEFRPLRCCGNDAAKLLERFSQRYQQCARRVLVTANAGLQPNSATLSGIVKEIDGLGLSGDDAVLFFFAGHGYHDKGRDYLVCSDTRRDHCDTALACADVLAALTQSGAGRSILVVDACRDDGGRSSSKFGEETAELARRRGIVAFFGCSPGEVCHELAVELGHGVFTYAVMEFLNESRDITPLLLDTAAREAVTRLCKEHKLGRQTPYTAVIPLQRAHMDIFTGAVVRSAPRPMRTVVILGLPYAGKTTLARRLTQEADGFCHVEMSAFLWRRFNEYQRLMEAREDERPMSRPIREFVVNDVWQVNGRGVLAQDLLNEHRGIDHLVVTGPRTVEELEEIRKARGDFTAVFVYSSSKSRYERYLQERKDSGQTWSFDEFIRSDMREYSWGLAQIACLNHTHLVSNESRAAVAESALLSLVKRNGA